MRIGIWLLAATVSVGAQEPVRFTRSVSDGVYTTQQAQRGEPLYRSYCAYCHGPDLLGRPDFPPPPASVPSGVTRWVFGTPPLKGAPFILQRRSTIPTGWTGE